MLSRKKSVNNFFVMSAAVPIILIAALAVLNNFFQSDQRQKGPICNEIYVWNHRWDKRVSNALDKAAPQTSSFLVLASEILWKSGQAHVKRIPVDYSTLKTTEKPIGLCLRVGPYSGPFSQQDKSTVLLLELASSLIAEASKSGVEPVEFQIDFDCAESKLDGYRIWVEALRTKIHPVPLTITALPCWLKQKTFLHLASATDGYVLQVHSLDQPAGMEASITLCNPKATLRWVEQAACIGIPFRVALPTYGYLLAFDKRSRFIGRRAEPSALAWNPKVINRTVFADPYAMARLVRTWQTNRPACMQGITWFRLPVEGDRMNWQWVTLSTVMAGQIPDRSITVKAEYPIPELAEIVLINTGNADWYSDVRVQVEWNQGKCVAADGLRGFVLTAIKHSSISLQSNSFHTLKRIAPGDSWKIGWIRFDQKTKVISNVISL